MVIGEIHPEAEKRLRERTNVIMLTHEQFCSLPLQNDIESLVLRTFTRCKKEELEKFPQVKYIVSCSVGTDNLDLEEMKRRNVELIHVPGTNANSVAEHTLYLIASLLRQDSPGLFFELKGKTVGIVGFGAIGKLVARKLRGFECSVIAFDVISQDEKVVQELHVEMKSFEDVLQLSDIITVHVPLLPQTLRLMNENAFSRMKEGAFFINTSRAEIVDEYALLKYTPKLRGVGLDVYSEELKRTLRGHIIFTPHVAAQGEDSFREQCVQPIEMFLKRIGNL